MRILFYLPVVTPWWFDSIVAPMIRAAAKGAQVSVLVPPLWRNTGVGPEQLHGCADIEGVDWYILDGDDHPKLRTSAEGTDLEALVEEIAPDLTLCRSADLDAASRFPGIVRFIMEGAAPPFTTAPTLAWLAPTLFDHGQMPLLSAGERALLDARVAPAWAERRALLETVDREPFLAQAGLDTSRKLIVVPLEYEHPEMFFGQHNVFADNVALIDDIAGRIGDDIQLAITDHPLNDLHGDPRPLRDAIARHGDKVRLVGQIGTPGLATALLARHCDGMVVGNSKCFALAAFFGVPMLRLTRFRSAAWLNAYGDADAFLADIRAGRAQGAAESDARVWFGYHLHEAAFDPADPRLDAATIAARATGRSAQALQEIAA